MLKVEPEIASKIQAGARERGVSVDEYLRELIDQNAKIPKGRQGFVRKSELACCECGRRVTVPTHRFFLTMQLVGKASTESVASLASRRFRSISRVLKTGALRMFSYISRQKDVRSRRPNFGHGIRPGGVLTFRGA